MLLILGIAAAAGAAYLVTNQPLLRSSTASTQVLVDTQSSSLVNSSGDVLELQTLAMALANYGTTQDVLNAIGSKVGISGSQLYAAGPTSANVPRAVVEPSAPQRNVQITGETAPYRLEFDADPSLPEIAIYSQAPTTAMAVKLANASVAALSQQVAALLKTGKIPGKYRVVLRQLGAPTGAPDTAGARKSLAAFAFVGVFVLWCVLILVSERMVGAWRASAGVVPSRKQQVALSESSEDDDLDPSGVGDGPTWRYAQLHRASVPMRAALSSTSETGEPGASTPKRQAAN